MSYETVGVFSQIGIVSTFYAQVRLKVIHHPGRSKTDSITVSYRGLTKTHLPTNICSYTWKQKCSKAYYMKCESYTILYYYSII